MEAGLAMQAAGERVKKTGVRQSELSPDWNPIPGLGSGVPFGVLVPLLEVGRRTGGNAPVDSSAAEATFWPQTSEARLSRAAVTRRMASSTVLPPAVRCPILRPIRASDLP